MYCTFERSFDKQEILLDRFQSCLIVLILLDCSILRKVTKTSILLSLSILAGTYSQEEHESHLLYLILLELKYDKDIMSNNKRSNQRYSMHLEFGWPVLSQRSYQTLM